MQKPFWPFNKEQRSKDDNLQQKKSQLKTTRELSMQNGDVWKNHISNLFGTKTRNLYMIIYKT
jgi:hypothetical protein